MKEPGILSFFAILLLCAVVYQDLKSRQVSLFLLVALFTGLSGLSYLHNGLGQASLFFLINVLFTVLELLFIYIYLRLREKITSFSEINAFVGYGDILFLATVCLVFSPFNYILFTLAGTFCCLLFAVAYSWIFQEDAGKIEIPYAGILAGCLILLFIGKLFIRNFNFYDDWLLMNILHE